MRSTVRSKKGAKKPAVAAAPAVIDSDTIPMMEDPNLPLGWVRKVIQRQTGKSAGKYDVYLISPQGRKLRSKSELSLYLREIDSNLDVNEFDFTIRGKANTLSPSPKSAILPNRSRRENGQPQASPAKKQELRQSGRTRGDRTKAEVEPTAPPSKTKSATRSKSTTTKDEGKGDHEEGAAEDKKTKDRSRSSKSPAKSTEEPEKSTRSGKRKDAAEATQKAPLPPKKKLRSDPDVVKEDAEDLGDAKGNDEPTADGASSEKGASPNTRSAANGAKKETTPKKKAPRKKGRAAAGPKKAAKSESTVEDPKPGPSGVTLASSVEQEPALPTPSESATVAAAEGDAPENGDHE